MGSPYQNQSVSGYNASPPADDGSTVAANKITWATIKTKITDPLNTFCSAINTALRSALNVSPSTTGVLYTTVKADHMTTVEATGTFTVSLGDAASMIADAVGYIVTVYNKGTGTVTVGVVTGTNTLAGQTNGTVTLQPGQSMTFTVAQSGVGYDIIGATGFAPFVLTGAAGTNAQTANSPANLIGLYSGLVVLLIPASANTGATTLAITPSGGAALTAKNIFWKGAALVGRELQGAIPYLLEYDGTQFNVLDGAANTLTVLRGYLAGLGMSTAGASTTMTTAAGQAADSTNAVLMSLAASSGKTTSAWAVGSGNGGLDTGAIANSTWYHFWLIMRPDTGVVDVLISLSASAPTMPTNYSFKRRIGAGKTNGSGQWTSFTQDGDYFRWAASVLDVNTTTPGTSAVSSTLTVPTGVAVDALLNASLADSAASNGLYLSDLNATDEAPSLSAAPLSQTAVSNTGAGVSSSWGGTIRANTSAQVRYRVIASGASTIVRIATLGWYDRRGRDS